MLRQVNELMSFENVLTALNEAVSASEGRSLNEAESTILRGAWEGLTYPEIAAQSPYSLNYLKQDVGPHLWKLLSRVLGRKVSKPHFRSFVESDFLAQISIPVLKFTEANPSTAYQILHAAVSRLDQTCRETARAAMSDRKNTLLLNAYVQTISEHLNIFCRNLSDLNDRVIQISGQYRLAAINQLLQQILEQFENGQFDRVAPDHRPTLYAVSYGEIQRWWETPLAQKFRDLNGQLTKYIRVERIFILPNPEAVQKMQTTIQWHRHLNIDVSVLVSDDPELRVSFMVCKPLFTNLIHISRNAEEIEGYISVDDRDIERNLQRFEIIKKIYHDRLHKVKIE